MPRMVRRIYVPQATTWIPRAARAAAILMLFVPMAAFAAVQGSAAHNENVATAQDSNPGAAQGGVNYGSCGFSTKGLVLNQKATLNGTRLQLTDGGNGENASAWYINVS